MRTNGFLVLVVSALLTACCTPVLAGNVIRVEGTGFTLNGDPFEFTGISFFNALYNAEFNKDAGTRQAYIRRFRGLGINVLRVWCQWDNTHGFIDGGKDKTLYHADGSLKPEVLSRVKGLARDADEEGCVILLVLFSRESWRNGIRLGDEEMDRAVAEITRGMQPHRNVIFQVWNEFDHRAIECYQTIKGLDPERLVTNSPGYAGFLGSDEENRMMDYLSPHTTRKDDRHWEIAEREIESLITKYGKPVVDDEPARKGTPRFGGPKNPTHPTDHVLHIYNVWRAGGYAIYHHDMFQTGYGSEAVPPNGIPLDGFSPYHDRVFEFLKRKERYLKHIR